MSENKPSKEGIAAIMMVGIVSIVCIIACARVMIAFIINAPWQESYPEGVSRTWYFRSAGNMTCLFSQSFCRSRG